MGRLYISPKGNRDFDELFDYIAEKDGRPLTAENVTTELSAACQRYADIIAAGSTIGTARPDLGEDCRVFTHKRWVVVFRALGDGIEVLRVFDGSRDYPRSLSE
jgi:plasmid stabilization system protein ParE